MTARSIIRWTFTRDFFREKVLPVRRIEGTEKNLGVVLGDNASGKSLFRKFVHAWCETRKVEFISLSMAQRTQTRVFRSFIYGDESYQATGFNTAKTVTTGISTAQNRTTPHVLFWDEPDTGLSDAYSADVGRRIREFVEKLPAMTKGVFVVSHRKALIAELQKTAPDALIFGSRTPVSVDAWLNTPIVPADLEELFDRSRATFEKVLAFENALKGKKR